MVRASLIGSNEQKNGVVWMKHPLKSTDEKTTVHWKTTQLTLIGI